MYPYLRFHLLMKPTGNPQERPRPRQHPAAPSHRTDGIRHEALTAPRVRRVLGKALIDAFCPFGEPLCQPLRQRGAAQKSPSELCHLAKSCPYGVLFAASETGRPPYSLYAPPTQADEADDLVELTLFGPGCRLYPWLLGSLERAFRRGLGKSRVKWEIHEVLRVQPDRRRERVCGRDLSRLSPTLSPDLLGLAIEPYLAPQPVVVELLSPTRLLQDGGLLPGSAPVPFQLLIARALDRFAGLYGAAASEILHAEIRVTIEEEASHVRLLADDTEWLEAPDYSARTGSELLLGGKVGRLIYGEEAARFFPILRSGEILHVGKNPTSGCGRIQVDLAPESGSQAAGSMVY